MFIRPPEARGAVLHDLTERHRLSRESLNDMAAPDYITPLISASAGLFGVMIGGWISARNQKQERRQRFIRDQLTEFYAPLLGMRKRLRAGGEIRLKVRTTAGAEWTRLEEEARAYSLDRLRELEEQRWPRFQRIIDDDNRKLEAEDIPQYHQMLDLFTAKMHLAEPSTRQHFSALVEFVELWDRCLRGALPGEVVQRIGPDEENLSGLYADLEANFTRLQSALKG